jgi:hypothetical protein
MMIIIIMGHEHKRETHGRSLGVGRNKGKDTEGEKGSKYSIYTHNYIHENSMMKSTSV